MSRIAPTLLLMLLALGAAMGADAPQIVVIAHPESGVDKLSKGEVIDIFLGRYRKLPGGRMAVPIDIGESSSERTAFYQALVKKSAAEMSAYWARLVFSGQTPPPFQVSDAKSAIELVQSSPNALAYVDRGAVTTGVKIVFEFQ